MSELAVFPVAYAGFLSLSLAMERHHRQFLTGAPDVLRRRLLRAAGYACLALAWLIATRARGVGIGTTLWVGAMAVTALAHAFALPYWPRRDRGTRR